jgi:hypothetical protein
MNPRAHFRNLITALFLSAFLAAMSPGIAHACGEIQQAVQSIQAHAGAPGALL